MKYTCSTLLASSLLLLAVTGCSATGTATSAAVPEVRQITQSAHCGLTGPGVAYIHSQESLESLLGVAGQNMSTGVIRQVDLQSEQLVIVTLGQKPTAGYSVGLADVAQDGSTLKLNMRVSQPAPDMMVAQVITSPCVVLAVTSGDWQRVEVTGVTEKPLVKRTGK